MGDGPWFVLAVAGVLGKLPTLHQRFAAPLLLYEDSNLLLGGYPHAAGHNDLPARPLAGVDVGRFSVRVPEVSSRDRL